MLASASPVDRCLRNARREPDRTVFLSSEERSLRWIPRVPGVRARDALSTTGARGSHACRAASTTPWPPVTAGRFALLYWAKRHPEPLVSRSSDPESTADLLTRIRAGDDLAREQLAARFLPVLRRWARGRLPVQARSLADTDDLVQVCLLRALNNIESFQATREGDFLAYMRKTLMNAVRDEMRRPVNRSNRQPVDDALPADGRSHLEEAIGREVLESYEAALAELTEPQQHAVMLRIEFGYSHAEVAEALGLASSDAARMLTARAVVKLADALHEHRQT